MRFCRWPNGCLLPVSLIEREGGSDRLCWYHWKTSWGAFSRPSRPPRGAVDPAAVISDEQRELGNLLRSLGATERYLRRVRPLGERCSAP